MTESGISGSRTHSLEVIAMKTQFKSWIGMLLGALLMMTLSIANADSSRTPPTNTDTPMTQSGEAKHRHPQGPPGKGPRHYLEHNTEAQQASEPAKAVRRGPPGKTPYRHRREVEKMPSPEKEK